MQFRLMLKLIFFCLGYTCLINAAQAVTLPFHDGFETGDFSRWQGGRTRGFSVTSETVHSGRYAARGSTMPGEGSDYYQDACFGDHPRVRGPAVTRGIFVRFAHQFARDFEFGVTSRFHKVLLINFEDQHDLRREQIILNVIGGNGSKRGQYVIENIHWNLDRSFGSSRLFEQNLGQPAAYRPGQWDTIKIFILPNTIGKHDGTVRVWINGELKIEHSGISMRETPYNPNLVIIGYYAPSRDIGGTRWWDDITISETDPDSAPPIKPDLSTNEPVQN